MRFFKHFARAAHEILNCYHNIYLFDFPYLGGEENTSIQLRQAIIMPVIGSISLVVLFYFLNIIYWLLVVLLGLAVFFSMIYVWQPIFGGIIKDILFREPRKLK